MIAQGGGQNRIAAPRNGAELDALTEKRDELREQLNSLNHQRSELADQIGRLGPDPALRDGPIARLRAIDQRIAQVESDLSASDETIAAAKAGGVGNEEGGPTVVRIPDIRVNTPDPFVWRGGQQAAWQEGFAENAHIIIPASFASLVLLGAVLYWRISRSMKNQLNKLLSMQQARLDEIQRSVDTVAVEMERVSENQRFVTKLVGEKSKV